MTLRYPRPLRAGDTIAVTAPSAGVEPRHEGRLDFAVGWLRERGFDVVEGNCLRGGTQVSAPVADRAAELNAFLTDSQIRAVIPPWGGETGIDLVDLLDEDAIRRAAPTWLVGFSDLTTLMLPLTLRTGLATLHGSNLMDTPYELPTGLAHWLEVAALDVGATFAQRATTHHRTPGWDKWEEDPTPITMPLTEPTQWRVLHGESSVSFGGRLIGGCVEVLGPLAGTPYADVRSWAGHQTEGTIVYLEVAGTDAYDVCRHLHALRLAGWFERANGVLIGRTRAPDSEYLTQDGAVIDALARLDLPIVAGVDFGHAPPSLSFVNGALASVQVADGRGEISQTLA
ncbi:S66 family peptidase [Calidifontibacter terrae]